MTPERRDLLFLCVANSARSQMAEGWGRSLGAAGGGAVHSAGSEPGQLHPMAVRVMAEVGIDLAGQVSKPIEDIPAEQIATVITLCTEEVCPAFLGDARRLHWPLEDPAAAGPDEEALLESFRRVRDEIGECLRAWLTARS